jgi:hypothetical protein
VINVSPEKFTKVDFSAEEIRSVASEVMQRTGGRSDDLVVELVIDEDQPTTRMAIASLEPLVFRLDSGALEDTREPRQFGEEMASVSLAALFVEYRDRVDPSFGAPPVGEPTDLAQRAAWSAYTHGRVQRFGYRVHQPKHRYNFRNRHGFSDAADQAFDALWSAAGLTWVDILAYCPQAT